jgi:hypothetical protein
MKVSCIFSEPERLRFPETTNLVQFLISTISDLQTSLLFSLCFFLNGLRYIPAFFFKISIFNLLQHINPHSPLVIILTYGLKQSSEPDDEYCLFSECPEPRKYCRWDEH